MAGAVASLQNTFDLMWKADQRAIKLWQEATGKDHIWPDKAKTTLWLLERLEAAEADRDRLKADVDAASAEAAKFICKNTELKLERDRLKAALQQIASQKTFAELEAEAEDDDYDLIGAWDIVIGVARKALGNA